MEQTGGSVYREPRFDLPAELHVQVVGRVFVGVLGVETLFGVVVAADQVIELLVAAADAQVVIPRRLGVVEEVVVPVEIGVVHVFAVFLYYPGPVGVLGPVVAALVQLAEILSVIARVGTAVVGFVEFVGKDGRIVSGRDEIRAGRRGRDAETAAVIDPHFAVRVVLRGDQDHAEAGAGSVDRRRGGVLEHRHRFHVVGVHPVDVALDAVDEHERGPAAVDRRHAADVEVGLGARKTGAVGDVEVGDHALQGLAQRRYRPVLELFGGYLRYRAQQVGLFLRAVTHDDDRLHALAVLFECDRHVRYGFECLVLIAQVGDDEVCALGYADEEASVVSRRGAAVAGLRDDGDADQRIAFVIGYLARYVDLFRLRSRGFLLFQEKHDLHVGDFESQIGRLQHAADRFRDGHIPRQERDFLGQIRFFDVVEERVSARFFDGADGFGKGDSGETGRDPLLRPPALAECYPPPTRRAER